MLLVLRLLLAILYCLLICVFGSLYCLFSPRDPQHVARFGRLFGRMSTLFGITVEQRMPQGAAQCNNCIYIANHQNNYDMVTTAKVTPLGSVTVGKKSLLWIPLFGPIYWLTGNLLIDRDNRTRAHGTIAQVVDQVKKRKLSILMFPEGTRSRGRGLLPFKTGAFHAAIAAGVPIVPICVSNTHGNINLNRWSNGRVIVEIMPPIDTRCYSKEQVRELTDHCRNLMLLKIKQLDEEIAAQTPL
ncbi:1-acylglycerol-3-phosphate O-acyltransferase [Candidatus Fukatsuia symbiotica]|uniref:1-acyl-sn-glycerol-3-phosphate acyltransferase n=1 Tax=Candidatus Fukatsuia symbiotica TaxID=1878942 RepID=A0A2U8I5U3_9GAMM|nr:1-acylglycerol-3-phosphate O-acyltransferase [Candidatus Fukatsuia symbiotica]AWK14508.1 1-acyl-sn-glycerol-3-phosphate acyltransferase [Candidatus Fukatsuia symbiotica]MEA9444801.1 1-acylglycerol-3-phosphate O-acyltransferase [Candidatus Fukatsuia symbiotica]